MNTITLRKPEDWLWPSFEPDDCVLTEDGWLGDVSDASKHSRSQAITRFLHEHDHGWIRRSEVRCRVAYIRPLTRQDAWEDYGRPTAVEEWSYSFHPPLRPVQRARSVIYLDVNGRRHECPVPQRVPDEWSAGDPWSVWKPCKRGDTNAVKVYICEAP